MTITVTQLTAGAAIKFPFELKDEFRQAFPSARWNRHNRQWEVGARSMKRLNEWVQEVRKSGVTEQIEARDKAELSEKEVSWLQAQIEKIKADINEEGDVLERARAANERCVALRAELEQHEETLEAARETRQAAEREHQSAQEIMAILATVADVEEIGSLRHEMKAAWHQLTADNKSRFTERQNRLKAIRSDLDSVGIESHALELAATANFNRPDRDKEDLLLALEFKFSTDD